MNITVAPAKPKVSVVMPVYNGEKYLQEAIDSILVQTFEDFEFVIINDGSTDRSREIIESYNDARIRLINQENRKLVSALNRGVAESRAELIARQDADDISLPQRLEREAEFLEAHPEVALLGSSFEVIDGGGRVMGTNFSPVRDIDIRQEIFLRSPFGHGTVMMRKRVLDEVGGYRADFRHNEDFDLWGRILASHRAANLPEALYRWRLNPDGICHQNTKAQSEDTRRILDSFWRERPFPCLTLGEVVRGSRYYRKLRSRLQPELHRHYLNVQGHLGLLLIQHGKVGAAFSSLAGGILADPLVAAYCGARAIKRTLAQAR